MTTISVKIAEPNWVVCQWRRHPERCWLSLVLAVAFILRVVRLGAHSYWQDEVHNLIKMEHLQSVMRGEYVSNHPPLFAALGTVWRFLGLDMNEWTMRLLPLTIGVCGVAAFYVLGRALFGARTGLVAAFLLAISPFHIYHSQDLKVYILLPFTGIVMAYALYRATEGNKLGQWLVYAVTAAVACYSEFFAGPLLVGLNLWFLAQIKGRWNRLPKWLLANALGALLFAPHLAVFTQKVGSIFGVGAQNWWIPRPTLWAVLFFVKAVAFGYSDLSPHFRVLTAVYCIVAAAGIPVAFFQNWRAALLLLCWFVIPVTFVYSLSLFTSSIFLIRALLPFAPPFYLFAAVLLTRPRHIMPRAVGVAVLAVIAGVSLSQHYRDKYAVLEWPHRPGIHPPCEFREGTQAVLDGWQEGDALVHASIATWLPFYWYGFRGEPHHYCAGVTSAFIDSINRGNPRTSQAAELDGYFPRELQRVVEGKSRVWYVFSEWERVYLESNPTAAWRWLDNHYHEVRHETFKGLEIFLYERERNGVPIQLVERDRDDGVRAQLRYGGGWEAVYEKTRPDSGLIPSPAEDRRGALTLRFEVSPEQGADTSEGRPVSFSIENHCDKEVRCMVELLPSDYLFPIAGLYESNPESDLWSITLRDNGNPPPGQYDVAAVTAHMNAPAEEVPAFEERLIGAVSLAPGHYMPYIYMQGSPFDMQYCRGGMQFIIGDSDIAGLMPRNRHDLNDWNWFVAGPLTVPPDHGPLPVEITPLPLPAARESWVILGYLALRQVPQRMYPGRTAALPKWPGELAVPARSKQTWTATVETGVRRVDIWAYERRESGKAYHIFRVGEEP